MIECVPNFSEGRDRTRIDQIQRAIESVTGACVLHRTSDADHNRSVITFAGAAGAVEEAALKAVAEAVALIDLTRQSGAHPRVGALDVLPFVPLLDATMDDCVQLAHRTGERIWSELGVPVYFYAAAAKRPDRIKLEDVRRGQFEILRQQVLTDESKRPDLGGPALHPTAGAVIVGARKVLIAFNINLQSNDLALAQSIAKRIRTSGGGFPALKALGVRLESRGIVQVSMNFTDLDQTPVHVVYEEVRRLAAERGVDILESELIGLIPQRALELASPASLKLVDFDDRRVIENCIAESPIRGLRPLS